MSATEETAKGALLQEDAVEAKAGGEAIENEQATEARLSALTLQNEVDSVLLPADTEVHPSVGTAASAPLDAAANQAPKESQMTTTSQPSDKPYIPTETAIQNDDPALVVPIEAPSRLAHEIPNEPQPERGESHPEDDDPVLATEFVNTGLALWERSRAEWLHQQQYNENVLPKHAHPLVVDEVIDTLFAGPLPFSQPIPLPQMVDILQDLWEAEGFDV